MADGGNQIANFDDERDQIHYGHQIVEFINNNALAPRERPNILQWMLQRQKTIETIDELITKLDIVSVGANCGKGFGNVAEISGAVVSIIGAFMALGKLESAAQVMDLGSLVNNSGSFVGGVSNIVESYACAEYLRNVKEILDKDKELSQPLKEWLAFSQSLDENVKIIFGCDLNSAIQNKVFKVFSEFATLYNSTRGFHATLEEMKKGKFAMHIGNAIQLDHLLKFSKELEASPKLRDTIAKLSESFILQVANDGIKVCQNLSGKSATTTESPPSNKKTMVSADSDGMNPSQNDQNVESASKNQAECPSVKAISVFCAFKAVDIASSIVSLISAIKAIEDGKSKFSDALKRISDCLQAELRCISRLN